MYFLPVNAAAISAGGNVDALTFLFTQIYGKICQIATANFVVLITNAKAEIFKSGFRFRSGIYISPFWN